MQPHAGSPGEHGGLPGADGPGHTVLGMELSQGGHLTHGSPVNFSGKLFHFVHYGVRRDTECIDYDQVRELRRRSSRE